MAQQARNLFESAIGRGRLIRQGDVACIVMDGAGASIVEMQDLLRAQRWAQSKPGSGNLLSDRGRFLDQFTVLVSRPGSQQATRGNAYQLERLARSMRQAGYDLSDWTLPPELKDPAHWIPASGDTEPAKKDAGKGAEKDADKGEDPAA